jgi:hypothetical protein
MRCLKIQLDKVLKKPPCWGLFCSRAKIVPVWPIEHKGDNAQLNSVQNRYYSVISILTNYAPRIIFGGSQFARFHVAN